MKQMGERIRRRRVELGLTQAAVGKAVGISRAAVAQWERNKNPLVPDVDKWAGLARALKVSREWLAFGTDDTTVTGVTSGLVEVPLISWVQAGQLAEATDPYPLGYAEETLTVPSTRRSLIALAVEGRSMDRIAPDGCTIVVDYEDRDLAAGQFYVVKNGGMATFKRFRQNPPRFEPYSTEPDHPTIFPDDHTEIVGRVVKVITDL